MDCPQCGHNMTYDKKMRFYICKRCATEVWPGEVTKQKDDRALYRWSLAAQTSAINEKPVLPPGVPVYKGSSKKGKKRKKKPKRDVFNTYQT